MVHLRRCRRRRLPSSTSPSSTDSTPDGRPGPSTLTPGLSLHNAQPQRCALTPAHPSTLPPASVCSTKCRFNSALGLRTLFPASLLSTKGRFLSAMGLQPIPRRYPRPASRTNRLFSSTLVQLGLQPVLGIIPGLRLQGRKSTGAAAAAYLEIKRTPHCATVRYKTPAPGNHSQPQRTTTLRQSPH
jgi:hypothetical protein